MKLNRVQSSEPAMVSEDFLFWRNVKRLLIILLTAVMTFISLGVYAASERPSRIVSLAPNLTEILFALGLEDRIAGVTSFCDHPEGALKKPKVGGMSNPSIEAVISLKPDIVVITTDGNPKEFEERLRSVGIRTYVFRAKRLSELPQGIRDLGKALGVKEKAEELAGNIDATFSQLTASKTPTKKKVLYIVWPEPLIVAGPGTVIDDAIRIVGAENLASNASASYPKYSVEDILRRQPDLIVIGKGMSKMDKVSEGFLKKLRSVKAVREQKVFYVSDDLYRLGPRTARGIRELSSLLDR